MINLTRSVSASDQVQNYDRRKLNQVLEDLAAKQPILEGITLDNCRRKQDQPLSIQGHGKIGQAELLIHLEFNRILGRPAEAKSCWAVISQDGNITGYGIRFHNHGAGSIATSFKMTEHQLYQVTSSVLTEFNPFKVSFLENLSEQAKLAAD